MSNRDIAENLLIEVGTVKNHVHSILEKLSMESRHQAAAYLQAALGNGGGSRSPGPPLRPSPIRGGGVLGHRPPMDPREGPMGIDRQGARIPANRGAPPPHGSDTQGS
jgi:hypothetical protein